MSSIADTISELTVEDVVSFEKLAFAPLTRPDSFDLDYITLEEATRSGSATVKETSMEGTVPELRFENVGDQAVLLLDGEELIGAKQNRIVNLTILAPANSELSIPVSCVEAGRWHHDSAEFSVSDRAMFSVARARKSEDISASLMRSGTRNSRQGEVWEDISMKAAQMDCVSPTEAMASMFEAHEGNLEEYAAALQAVANQVGAVFLINGQIAGIELFDHTTTMNKMMPKLVKSYALDAIDTSPRSEPSDRTPLTTEEFLKHLPTAQVRSFPAIGEGNDLRLTDERYAGGALEARGRLIHLCAFPKRQHLPDLNGDSNGLARASIRRRSYR